MERVSVGGVLKGSEVLVGFRRGGGGGGKRIYRVLWEISMGMWDLGGVPGLLWKFGGVSQRGRRGPGGEARRGCGGSGGV